MKKLHLIRHAKSEWKDTTLSDIERPINSKGIASCHTIASHIHQAGCNFSHVFCSAATRTQQTITELAKSLPELPITWTVDPELYTFDHEQLIGWLSEQNDGIDEIVIIGHNPAITNTANYLGDRPIAHVPTCSYVQLTTSSTSWAEVTSSSMNLHTFLTPKMFRES